MRYSHLLGDFRHDFGPQLDLGLRPRCSASAQYHAFRLVQQKAISNTYWHAGTPCLLALATGKPPLTLLEASVNSVE